MGNKKRTAVDWLMSEVWVRLNMDLEWREKVYEQAKVMEKEQIKDAWDDGAYGGGQFTTTHDSSEQYYEETYE